MTGLNIDLIVRHARAMVGGNDGFLERLIVEKNYETIMEIFSIRQDGSVRLMEAVKR